MEAVSPQAPPIEPPAAPQPSTEEVEKIWFGLLERLETAMVRNQRTRASIGQNMGAAKRLVEWFVAEKWTPTSLPPDFRVRFKTWREENVRAAPQRLLYVKLVDLFLDPDEIEKTMPARAAPPPPVRAAPPPPPPEEQEEYEDEEEEGDEEEVPRQQTQGVPTVRVQVDGPRARQPRPPRQASPGRGILPKTREQKVDVFRREPNGHQTYIDQYDAFEIEQAGGPFKFLKEFVDPQSADPSGLTTYELYEVGPNGKAKENGVSFTVESRPTESPRENIAQLRDMADLVKELGGNNGKGGLDVLELAKQRIAASGGGSMTDIIMLFMLNQMAGGRSSSADEFIKIAEKMGMVKPSGAPAGIPIGPPVALAPPPPNEFAGVAARVLESKLTEKPPEPKSTLDFVKEMAAIREVFGPKEDPAMKAILEELKEMRKAGAVAGGNSLADAVKNISDMKSTFQAVAPMFKLDGFTGLVNSLMQNPAVAQNFAQLLGAAAQKLQSAPPPQQDPNRIPVHPQPVPQQPQRQLPAGAVAALKALHEAKEEKLAIAQVLLGFQAIAMDVQWNPVTQPRFEAVSRGDIQPMRALIAEFISFARKDLVTEDFVDKVLAEMVEQLIAAGFSVPESVVALVKKPTVAPPPPPAPVVEAAHTNGTSPVATESEPVVATVTG